MAKLVTFHTWPADDQQSKLVSFDPDEVSDVEDYCGNINPGSLITLKNKRTYLVAGAHTHIVRAVESARLPRTDGQPPVRKQKKRKRK